MSEDKFHDIDGNPCSLETLCKREPGWAASRIREERRQLAELTAQFAKLDRLRASLRSKDESLEATLRRMTEIMETSNRAQGEMATLRADLTYALELLATSDPSAKASDGATAIDVLLRTSQSLDSVVREGAVYGMAGHLSDSRVVARLREMAGAEASAAVRTAAREALEDRSAKPADGWKETT